MRSCLGFMLLCLLSPNALAQQPGAKCSGTVPDSSWFANGPVYRDCEVEKRAKRGGREPVLEADILKGAPPVRGCLEAELEFVVDTTGVPEPATVRVRSTDSQALARAVVSTLSQLRFTPARLADRPVRQLVVYARKVSSVISFKVAPLGNRMEPPLYSRPLALQPC